MGIISISSSSSFFLSFFLSFLPSFHSYLHCTIIWIIFHMTSMTSFSVFLFVFRLLLLLISAHNFLLRGWVGSSSTELNRSLWMTWIGNTEEVELIFGWNPVRLDNMERFSQDWRFEWSVRLVWSHADKFNSISDIQTRVSMELRFI